MPDLDMLMPAIIAIVGAGGMWQLFALKAKQAHEARLADKQERGEFNDTLKMQVDRLAEQVNTLTAQKEELLLAMSELKAELSAAKVTIAHLETRLMSK
jgi:outer membrane murein-binding lipoprotein Lpp